MNSSTPTMGWMGPGVMPAPPGKTANFVNPENQTNGTIALHTICLFFATICFAARIYTRKFINNALGLDDYCCILAYCLTIGFSTLMIVGNKNGLGRHLWDVRLTELPNALRALSIGEYVYLVLAATIKLSCLLFYRRVFSPSAKTLFFVHAGIVFVVVSYTAMLFATIFECTPVQKSWYPATPGHCFKEKILPYTSGAINVVTDIYVLILPIPALLNLKLGTSRKIRVMAIFGLGIFTCATSIIRLGMTALLYSDFDSTWRLSQIAIWAVLEVNVGIVCSSLLAFPAFLKKHGPKDIGSSLARLFSYNTSRRRGESYTNSGGKPTTQSYRYKMSNPSDEANLNGSHYVELSAKQPGPRDIQVTTMVTSDLHHDPQHPADPYKRDIEAWSGIGNK